MKFLLTTHPGIGHLHPMVPIAQALEGAGHEVAFASAPGFCERIESSGFVAFPAGLDWLESRSEQTFPELREMAIEQQHLWFLTEVFAGSAARKMIPDLFAICERWRPDIIVRNDYEFAGCVVAERIGIPHATIGVDLLISVALLESLIGAQLAGLREIAGLPSQSPMDMLYRYLYLSLMPPGYQFNDSRGIPIIHSLRATIFDRSVNGGLPDWVSHLPARPTVYATLGTAFNRAPAVFQAIIEGLREEPVNLILTVGPDQDREQFGPQPANVFIETYIPQTLLFPHCDLVILSGSSNTVITALSYGLPMILIPLNSTQPLHAMRCASLGVGRVIKQRDMFDAYLYDRSYAELSPETVRTAVRKLLHDPTYRRNAQRLREEIRSLPGPAKAVELLTRLALEKRPQLALTI